MAAPPNLAREDAQNAVASASLRPARHRLAPRRYRNRDYLYFVMQSVCCATASPAAIFARRDVNQPLQDKGRFRPAPR
jgi:hypothetical protein